jgi:hypothetical protein
VTRGGHSGKLAIHMKVAVRSRAARVGGAVGCALAVLIVSSAAGAAEASARERQLTPEEIEAWLDSRALPKSQADSSEDLSDAPPPPPREKGFVLESSIGVLGHLGHMRHVTPNAPWFGLRFGYEPLRWLMVFAETDLFVASTAYANPPPPARSFAYWGFGAGFRLTVRPLEWMGLYLQGSLGAARATEDVLEVYGYRDAQELSLYQSAELGIEWYQVSPHLALALHGGVRNYGRGFKRDRDTEAPLAWLSGLALRYTF